jgi:hypothetical protein
MKNQPNKSSYLFNRNSTEGKVSGQGYSSFLKSADKSGFSTKTERTIYKNGYLKVKKK